MLSLVGVVTAVTSAITGAVLSTLKNGSSLPHELMMKARLGIRKMKKNRFISFSAEKNKQILSESDNVENFSLFTIIVKIWITRYFEGICLILKVLNYLKKESRAESVKIEIKVEIKTAPLDNSCPALYLLAKRKGLTPVGIAARITIT